jgi:hypothetical protein
VWLTNIFLNVRVVFNLYKKWGSFKVISFHATKYSWLHGIKKALNKIPFTLRYYKLNIDPKQPMILLTYQRVHNWHLSSRQHIYKRSLTLHLWQNMSPHFYNTCYWNSLKSKTYQRLNDNIFILMIVKAKNIFFLYNACI